MNKLEGKIALITGGNSGIGLATAKQLVNEGAYVFITGRREQQLAAAVKEIGKNVTGVQGDVSNLGDLDRLFAQIKREKGKLDIVFANAGGALPLIPLGETCSLRNRGFQRRPQSRSRRPSTDLLGQVTPPTRRPARPRGRPSDREERID